MTPQRINEDAIKYERFNSTILTTFPVPISEHYIAGATAVNDNAQGLVDALERISGGPQTRTDAVNIAKEALAKWKGEVEQTDKEKYQQWIKENVIVLGEFDFIVGQKRITGKKELRRVYEYLTNQQKSK